MKKLFVMMISLYCLVNSTVVSAGIGRDLRDMNRSLLNAVDGALFSNNLNTSLVSLFTHNVVLKKSLNLFEMRDKQLVTSLACGWLGSALNRLSFVQKLPDLVKVPFNHPFATSWLAYNLIVNRANIMRDPANLIVGGYLALSAINECN